MEAACQYRGVAAISRIPRYMVDTETPRPALGRIVCKMKLKTENPSTSLDLSRKNWGEVSTATRTLQNVDGDLSKTEAASPAGDATFGAKRSGPPRIQRAPEVSILKIVEEEEGLSRAQFGGNSGEAEGVTPCSIFDAYEDTRPRDCRNQ